MDSSLSARGPETQQEGCVFGDGSWDGLRGFVGRASSLLDDCQLSSLGVGTRQHTIIVYYRALVKPEVPTRFFAVWKRAWKSDLYRTVEPSDFVEP